MNEMETAREQLPNGPKPISGSEAVAGNPTSAHEAARFVADAVAH